jgi:hypothetical protein
LFSIKFIVPCGTQGRQRWVGVMNYDSLERKRMKEESEIKPT